jgi:hypothetical protein
VVENGKDPSDSNLFLKWEPPLIRTYIDKNGNIVCVYKTPFNEFGNKLTVKPKGRKK